MIINKNSLRGGLMILICSFLTVLLFPIRVMAADDCLNDLSAGAAIALNVDITLKDEELMQIAQAVAPVKKEDWKTKQKEESKLVMANVQESLNIRTEADENASKAGVLYKDCGGEVLERRNGWTKLRSGNLVGWAKDEFLLYGTEAENLAKEVGNLVAKVNTETLRIRKAADDNAEVYGLLAVNDEIMALEEKENWVSIDFDGSVGYVAADYVSVDFKIDSGETMAVINERAKKEAAEKEARLAAETKAKQKENRGAVPADVSEASLLAALIQCEAGGESYEGQLAVGAVVMNRLRSGAYPSSLQGVIYASGQFTPAMNGKVANVAARGPKASCMQAAQEAINGASNIGGATHFRRAGAREGLVIGNHVFW